MASVKPKSDKKKATIPTPERRALFLVPSVSHYILPPTFRESDKVYALLHVVYMIV